MKLLQNQILLYQCVFPIIIWGIIQKGFPEQAFFLSDLSMFYARHVTAVSKILIGQLIFLPVICYVVLSRIGDKFRGRMKR
jgi:hypothetical protein